MRWPKSRHQKLMAVGFAGYLMATLGCGSGVESTPASAGPSASEIFRLRTECAALGERVLRVNGPNRPGLDVSQQSNYDAIGNRCYVLLTQMDLNPGARYHARYLVDGQTMQHLVMTTSIDGVLEASISLGDPMKSVPRSDLFIEASSLIDRFMRDDRKIPEK
jgi:hypothetical protein